MADDFEDGDPGLAAERTDLSWTRTAIAFAALGGALLRYRPAAGIPILVVAAVVWQLARPPSTFWAGQAHDRRLLVITAAIVGIAVAALIISFLGPTSPGLHF